MPEPTKEEWQKFAVDFEAANAEHLTATHFQNFIRMTLQALAGDGNFNLPLMELTSVMRIADEHDVKLIDVMRKEFRIMSDTAMPCRLESDERDGEITSIIRASLRVASERMAVDNAARGRLSQRESALHRAIENHEDGRRRRASGIRRG